MFSIDEMISFLPPLLGGAYITISVSLLSFALAAIIGLMMGIARISRSLLLRAIATPYVQFIRGTPLLLQLFFIYYV
ncbi:MAG: ABC transporter permease subunit, partial [Beijerinckiaceae bacterium]